MAKAPPFVAFYASAYISGTRKIPPMERLVYMEILALIYDEGGPIEYENRDLARFIGVTAAVCKRAVDGLVARRKITLEDGVISNERADKELAKAGAKSAGAKAAADARWSKAETKMGKVDQDFDQNRSPILSEYDNEINGPDMRTHPSRNATKTKTKIKTEEVREVRAPAASTSTGPRLEDFVSDEAARDYRAHRVALKAKLTPGAEKGICRELTKICAMGLDPTEALETAAARGWRAVKAEWIVNDQAKDAGHGQQPRGPQARAEIASDKANDFWASYDAQADGDPFRSGDFGSAERGPDDPWRDSGNGESAIEGVVLRPAFVRR
jgi:uncharacterized protein YdaU (DUF1376 family)